MRLSVRFKTLMTILMIWSLEDSTNRHVHILIRDFKSGYNAFCLRLVNLPWDEKKTFQVKYLLLDDRHRLDVVDEFNSKGGVFNIKKPFKSGSVCLTNRDSATGQRQLILYKCSLVYNGH